MEDTQAYKRRASVLDPCAPYFVGRWNEDCHNGEKLYREIGERSYQNSERSEYYSTENTR